MGEYTRREAAQRAGVDAEDVDRLIEVGILVPDQDRTLSIGDVRRVRLVRSFEDAGIPLDSLAAGLHQGVISLAFVDSPTYGRLAALGAETYEAASARTGVPLPLLAVIREAIGLAPARPGDRIPQDELAILPFVERQIQLGFRPAAIERLLRATGDSLRRVAESEADWWRSEVTTPRLVAGMTGVELNDNDNAEDLSNLSEQSLLAIYHAQQAQAWTANIILGFEYQLRAAGLYTPLERPPAICFLDITGYTRLTQERGDQAAAELAEQLARIVQRTSIEHGGRPVKWLGDGVMFLFKNAGPGVLAALEMVERLQDAGLPPAHVGLDAGPVVFRESDYYGQTVNIAARIADYARPGEVLVSEAVVDSSQMTKVRFTAIGPVELKGVSGVMQLHAARRTF